MPRFARSYGLSQNGVRDALTPGKPDEPFDLENAQLVTRRSTLNYSTRSQFFNLLASDAAQKF